MKFNTKFLGTIFLGVFLQAPVSPVTECSIVDAYLIEDALQSKGLSLENWHTSKINEALGRARKAFKFAYPVAREESTNMWRYDAKSGRDVVASIFFSKLFKDGTVTYKIHSFSNRGKTDNMVFALMLTTMRQAMNLEFSRRKQYIRFQVDSDYLEAGGGELRKALALLPISYYSKMAGFRFVREKIVAGDGASNEDATSWLVWQAEQRVRPIPPRID